MKADDENDHSITVTIHYLSYGLPHEWRSVGSSRLRSGAMQDYLKRYMPAFVPLYSEIDPAVTLRREMDDSLRSEMDK